jgi:hypothetical protein
VARARGSDRRRRRLRSADALHGGLRDESVRRRRRDGDGASCRRGALGVHGHRLLQRPADGCRLHSLELAGFTEAQPPNSSGAGSRCHRTGRGAPRRAAGARSGRRRGAGSDELRLESGPGQTIVVRGRAPAFKPDGTLTQVRDGELVEWSIHCRAERPPLHAARRQRDRALRPHALSAPRRQRRLVLELPLRRRPAPRELVIVDGRAWSSSATCRAFARASLELSPKRTFATCGSTASSRHCSTPEAGRPHRAGRRGDLARVGAERAVGAGGDTRRAGLPASPDTGDARVRRLGISARDLAWR